VEGLAVRFATNRHGMAWREVEEARAPGVRRIAVLGDSFTMGCWAANWRDGFVGVMERELGAGFEALNFGVGGYGLLDHELILREQALRFAPDLVIVALFVGNDFRDTWLGLDKERLEGGAAVLDEQVLYRRVPGVARQADGVRSPACAPTGLDAWLARSALFRRAERALGRDGLCVDFRPSAQFVQFSYWSRSAPSPVALEARDASLQALDAIRAATEAAGARLGVVVVPTFEQVHARRWQGRDFDLALPQAWVSDWARARQVPYLDLLPPMREHLARTGERLYLRRDVHWNARGHAFAGEAIAHWVRCCARPR
jgi:lysophospholipase L1-like esterase